MKTTRWMLCILTALAAQHAAAQVVKTKLPNESLADSVVAPSAGHPASAAAPGSRPAANRAFAVSEDGKLMTSAGSGASPDVAAEDALRLCKAVSKINCRLYTTNSAVISRP
jgi:hypothetical protein